MTKAKKEAALQKLEEMYPEAKAELVFSNPIRMKCWLRQCFPLSARISR